MRTLRNFYPNTRSEDWRPIDAGIRVQAIKSSEGKTRIMHYGTEIIIDKLSTIAALLGAWPGASVSASIAVQVIEQCMPKLLRDPAGRERMQAVVPSYGVDIKARQNALWYAETGRRADHASQLTGPIS